MKPNVLCVGFAKCGTTTLYDILKQHPDIYLSKIKEPIYYGDKQLIEQKGFKWYLKRYYPKRISKKVIMEINPILARDVDPKQIKLDYGKDVKIIFLIRNPIERLYSEFKMNLVDGTCFPVVSDNLGNSTKKMFDKWVKDNFFRYKNTYRLRDSHLSKLCESGDYYNKINKYITTFGKRNVKIIFFEDLVKNPKKECFKIFDFISVNHDKEINYDIHSNEGNRLPINKFTIKANQIWFVKIYKKVLIAKLPFISNQVCWLINCLTWNVIPLMLSKKNNNIEKIGDRSKKIIEKYYYDMIKKLSRLINIDLFSKWNIKY